MTGPPIIPHSAIEPNFDYWNTALSQYANSPILMGMIGSFNDALDTTAFFDSLYKNIWNVTTANGYGLDVWGRIVGVTRNLQIASPVAATFFGFQEGGWLGFGDQGQFYTGGAGGSGATLVTNITLLDNDFRTLILAKAGANISDGSIRSLNNLLMNLFPGRGTIYVIDNQNMTITLLFTFALTATEIAIINSGVLPIPTGVSFSVTQSPPIETHDESLLMTVARRGWIPVNAPIYMRTVGGSAVGSVGGTSGGDISFGSFIIPGPMQRLKRW